MQPIRNENYGNYLLKIMGISVFGKFILTGSSTPADKTEVYHSGADMDTSIACRLYSFLLVLTAVGPAYHREDGVFVAPINLLSP
jgi:hypothetical protein